MQEPGSAGLKPLNMGRSLVDADAEDSDDDFEVLVLMPDMLGISEQHPYAFCSVSACNVSAQTSSTTVK